MSTKWRSWAIAATMVAMASIPISTAAPNWDFDAPWQQTAPEPTGVEVDGTGVLVGTIGNWIRCDGAWNPVYHEETNTTDTRVLRHVKVEYSSLTVGHVNQDNGRIVEQWDQCNLGSVVPRPTVQACISGIQYGVHDCYAGTCVPGTLGVAENQGLWVAAAGWCDGGGVCEAIGLVVVAECNTMQTSGGAHCRFYGVIFVGACTFGS